jgi:hypothetical protein
VRWFKIVPVIELLGFDSIRNKYAKKITYFVRAFTHYNNSDPRVPKSIPQGAVKQYDYMYTGNNTEVIDFRIEFNTLAYTLINVSRSKTEVLNQSGGANRNNVYSQQSPQPSGSFQPNQQDYVSGTQHSMVSGAHESSEKSLARGYADSIYSNSGGDMISVKLKILGDPDFIKQDEFLYHPGAIGVGYNSQFLPGAGNSLNMDSGEIFCEVRFRSPVDMDEGTGMMRQDGAYSTSYFSGIYKVISVENDFSRGQFTQTLNLIRYPNQPEDAPTSGQVNIGDMSVDREPTVNQNTDADSDLEAE